MNNKFKGYNQKINVVKTKIVGCYKENILTTIIRLENKKINQVSFF